MGGDRLQNARLLLPRNKVGELSVRLWRAAAGYLHFSPVLQGKPEPNKSRSGAASS